MSKKSPPVASEYLDMFEKRHSYQIHQQNIRNIKSIIDTSCPIIAPRIQAYRKRREYEIQRQIRADAQNIKLITKLIHKNTNDGKIRNSSGKRDWLRELNHKSQWVPNQANCPKLLFDSNKQDETLFNDDGFTVTDDEAAVHGGKNNQYTNLLKQSPGPKIAKVNESKLPPISGSHKKSSSDQRSRINVLKVDPDTARRIKKGDNENNSSKCTSVNDDGQNSQLSELCDLKNKEDVSKNNLQGADDDYHDNVTDNDHLNANLKQQITEIASKILDNRADGVGDEDFEGFDDEIRFDDNESNSDGLDDHEKQARYSNVIRSILTGDQEEGASDDESIILSKFVNDILKASLKQYEDDLNDICLIANKEVDYIINNSLPRDGSPRSSSIIEDSLIQGQKSPVKLDEDDIGSTENRSNLEDEVTKASLDSKDTLSNFTERTSALDTENNNSSEQLVTNSNDIGSNVAVEQEADNSTTLEVTKENSENINVTADASDNAVERANTSELTGEHEIKTEDNDNENKGLDSTSKEVNEITNAIDENDSGNTSSRKTDAMDSKVCDNDSKDEIIDSQNPDSSMRLDDELADKSLANEAEEETGEPLNDNFENGQPTKKEIQKEILIEEPTEETREIIYKTVNDIISNIINDFEEFDKVIADICQQICDNSLKDYERNVVEKSNLQNTTDDNPTHCDGSESLRDSGKHEEKLNDIPASQTGDVKEGVEEPHSHDENEEVKAEAPQQKERKVKKSDAYIEKLSKRVLSDVLKQSLAMIGKGNKELDALANKFTSHILKKSINNIKQCEKEMCTITSEFVESIIKHAISNVDVVWNHAKVTVQHSESETHPSNQTSNQTEDNPTNISQIKDESENKTSPKGTETNVSSSENVETVDNTDNAQTSNDISNTVESKANEDAPDSTSKIEENIKSSEVEGRTSDKKKNPPLEIQSLSKKFVTHYVQKVLHKIEQNEKDASVLSKKLTDHVVSRVINKIEQDWQETSKLVARLTKEILSLSIIKLQNSPKKESITKSPSPKATTEDKLSSRSDTNKDDQNVNTKHKSKDIDILSKKLTSHVVKKALSNIEKYEKDLISLANAYTKHVLKKSMNNIERYDKDIETLSGKLTSFIIKKSLRSVDDKYISSISKPTKDPSEIGTVDKDSDKKSPDSHSKSGTQKDSKNSNKEEDTQRRSRSRMSNASANGDADSEDNKENEEHSVNQVNDKDVSRELRKSDAKDDKRNSSSARKSGRTTDGVKQLSSKFTAYVIRKSIENYNKQLRIIPPISSEIMNEVVDKSLQNVEVIDIANTTIQEASEKAIDTLGSLSHVFDEKTSNLSKDA